MPTEFPPDQRRLSAAISATLKHEPLPFSGQVPNLTQKETEFWKSGSTAGTVGGVKKMIASRSKPTANFLPGSEEKLESHQSRQQNGILGLQNVMGTEKKSAFSVSPWRFTDYDFGFLSNIHQPSSPTNANGNRADLGVLHENSLFSNSLPETFGQKVTLSSRDVSFHQPTHQVHSSVNEEEPLESLKEIEARTIGDLLPDDDDLFSGVDNIECMPQSNNLDDAEEDIFGMELEVDDVRGSNRASRQASMISNGATTGPISSYSGEHPLGELPSRTLFVRNINSSVEDDELKSLFEKYGDIKTLYTACKHRGFVMICYYDIRSASNAIKLLQNKPLRRRKLDIHFSIPKDNLSEKDINEGIISVSNLDSSVSNDAIHQIFRVYGEIKEIREAPHKHCQKTVEFYDSRNAEAAIHALDGSLISGRQIKLDPSRRQFTMRGLMQQFPSDLEKGEDEKWQKGSPPNGSTVRPGLLSNGVNNVALHGQFISQEKVSSACDASSAFPHFISSRNPSVGNLEDQSGAAGIEGSLEKINLGFQRIPSIHSHSLPECQNSLATGVFPNSPTMMPAMDARISRHPDGIDSRHIKGGFSYNHNGAFVAPGNSSCPLHGHQCSRDKFHSHHPSHMGNFMWQNSPPFVNGISPRSPSPMHGFQRSSSHMANMVPFHHHGGSAPSTNAPLWDRHHAYSSDLVDSSHFHPVSLGNMGFSASPTLHPMELASRNIFPFPEGNCMEPSLAGPHIGIPSQQCQIFAGQNPMIHLNGRYDAHNDRMRNRKSDSTSIQGDKKQYELDIERIIRGEDNRTTLMIKNIPNKYTSKMLLATIDEHHRGTYDFIYLPIDFKNKCNVGYAFINLTDPKHIISFYEAFNGKKWEKFNSEKVASLAYARIQGKTALVAHFQNSSLMNEDKRCRPILFHSEGPNAGDQEPFPMGPSIRSRYGRSRSNNSDDDDHQDSPPKSSGEEEVSIGLNASIGELSIAC